MLPSLTCLSIDSTASDTRTEEQTREDAAAITAFMNWDYDEELAKQYNSLEPEVIDRLKPFKQKTYNFIYTVLEYTGRGPDVVRHLWMHFSQYSFTLRSISIQGALSRVTNRMAGRLFELTQGYMQATFPTERPLDRREIVLGTPPPLMDAPFRD